MTACGYIAHGYFAIGALTGCWAGFNVLRDGEELLAGALVFAVNLVLWPLWFAK